MALYDEALAKSLETGDSKDLVQVMFFGAESLEKAHIKAHFRLNPKTGKREFIKDYDDARHKDEVHISFHKGHKVKVNNPKSKHHGKVMEVTGYSDKYDVVRGKIDGEKNSVDFHADHIEHHDGKAEAPKAGGKLDMSRYQVYADRPDMDDTVYHIPRDKAKDGEPRFLRVNKKTGDWSKHETKNINAPAVESGKAAADVTDDPAKLKAELSKLQDALKSSDLRPGTENYIYDRIRTIKQKLGLDAAATDKKSEVKESTGKISADLKAKIDSLSPTEKFTVVNDYLGIRVYAGDRNFRADKDGGTDRFLAHINIAEYPIKKIEEAVDRMLAQKERGKMEPPNDKAAPEYQFKRGDTVITPSGVKRQVIKGAIEKATGREKVLVQEPRGQVWYEAGKLKKVDEGGAAPTAEPAPAKLKYDKFGAHVKSGVNSAADAEKILKEYGFAWDKSDKSGSLGGAFYEKDGKGVAHFDAAGKTLTIYEPKEKADSKSGQPKAAAASDLGKFTGKEKEVDVPGDSGVGPRSFEKRYPHIKEFFNEATDTKHLGKLKKQAEKWAQENTGKWVDGKFVESPHDGWKYGPIEHFYKQTYEDLKEAGLSGHKAIDQAAQAKARRLDQLSRVRDSSGRATPRRRS